MYLEHLDENENFCVFEVDGPPARNARDDGINDCLARQRVVIAHFQFDLVLHAMRNQIRRYVRVSRGFRPLIPTGRTGWKFL
jgi:hypothetical protein